MTGNTEMATTENLHMIRAEIDVRRFQRWMGSRRLEDPDHAMHCLLIECYGELAPKPFRAILSRGGATGVLYGYGDADEKTLRDQAATFADPLQASILPPDTLDSKPMPGNWQSGKRLGFEIRIRPVVRLERDPSKVAAGVQRKFKDGGLRPGSECDVFLHEALQYPEKGTMQRTREEVYAEWLSQQLDRRGGASLNMSSTRLVSFQRTRAIRKLHSRHSEGPDAVMRGNITVTDPDAFTRLLSHGIGRHRAYGYGMLLLRPTR